MPQMPMPGGGASSGSDPNGGNAAATSPHAPPFPHGDMDLSFIPANVVAPNAPRTGHDRQFYFLKKPNVPGGG